MEAANATTHKEEAKKRLSLEEVINRNVREDEANLGQGAGNPVDPDEERMFPSDARLAC